MAGRAEGWRAHPHGCRVLARYAGEDLRAASAVGEAPRLDRMARRRGEFLRLRRSEVDGEGCARHAGARLCGCEGAVGRSRRASGRGARTLQALPAGCVLMTLSR